MRVWTSGDNGLRLSVWRILNHGCCGEQTTAGCERHNGGGMGKTVGLMSAVAQRSVRCDR